MTDTLFIVSIIISLIAIVRPWERSRTLMVPTQDIPTEQEMEKLSFCTVSILWFLHSQNEIKALDYVYATMSADLIRHTKSKDDLFFIQCQTIITNYYEVCRAKLQQDTAIGTVSLN